MEIALNSRAPRFGATVLYGAEGPLMACLSWVYRELTRRVIIGIVVFIEWRFGATVSYGRWFQGGFQLSPCRWCRHWKWYRLLGVRIQNSAVFLRGGGPPILHVPLVSGSLLVRRVAHASLVILRCVCSFPLVPSACGRVMAGDTFRRFTTVHWHVFRSPEEYRNLDVSGR